MQAVIYPIRERQNANDQSQRSRRDPNLPAYKHGKLLIVAWIEHFILQKWGYARKKAIEAIYLAIKTT